MFLCFYMNFGSSYYFLEILKKQNCTRITRAIEPILAQDHCLCGAWQATRSRWAAPAGSAQWWNRLSLPMLPVWSGRAPALVAAHVVPLAARTLVVNRGSRCLSGDGQSTGVARRTSRARRRGWGHACEVGRRAEVRTPCTAAVDDGDEQGGD
jgi:hypothetical protein